MENTPSASPISEELLIKILQNPTIFNLAQQILDKWAQKQYELTIVGLVGVPGVGKTTTAQYLEAAINRMAFQSTIPLKNIAKAFPMDGFHYYKNEFHKFQNPTEAFARRGSYWTFNSKKFYQKIRAIVSSEQLKIGFPSFDHFVGDPIEDDIIFEKEFTKIAIFEGLYLLSDYDDFTHVKDFLDLKIYLEDDINEAMKRLMERNKKAFNLNGLEAQQRMEDNDYKNGEAVLPTKKYADIVVQYKDLIIT